MAEKLVRSFDMDDTLVDRGNPVRAWGLSGFIAKGATFENFPDLQSVRRIDHRVVDAPAGALEKIKINEHGKRKLLPGVKEALRELSSGDTHSQNHINSGRYAETAYLQMTLEQLNRLGIGMYFTREKFKPRGTSSTESKLDVIRSLIEEGNRVEHFEDDPRTAIVMAKLFPEVTVHLVDQPFTRRMIPLSTLQRFPNIHVVKSIGQAI